MWEYSRIFPSIRSRDAFRPIVCKRKDLMDYNYWYLLHNLERILREKLRDDTSIVFKLFPQSFSKVCVGSLARTGNYQIHEFDWLKSILKAV